LGLLVSWFSFFVFCVCFFGWGIFGGCFLVVYGCFDLVFYVLGFVIEFLWIVGKCVWIVCFVVLFFFSDIVWLVLFCDFFLI